MALRSFFEEFISASTSPRNLLWQMDSTTTIAYIVYQDGTLSLPLLQLAMMILE